MNLIRKISREQLWGEIFRIYIIPSWWVGRAYYISQIPTPLHRLRGSMFFTENLTAFNPLIHLNIYQPFYNLQSSLSSVSQYLLGHLKASALQKLSSITSTDNPCQQTAAQFHPAESLASFSVPDVRAHHPDIAARGARNATGRPISLFVPVLRNTTVSWSERLLRVPRSLNQQTT